MELREISPLFWPVREEGEGFAVLDETRLPYEVEYLPVGTTQEALDVVRLMKTRAFGQALTFLHALLLDLKRSPALQGADLHEKVAGLGRLFAETRPTFPFEGLAMQVLGWAPRDTGKADGAFLVGEIERYFRILMKMREKRAQLMVSLLPQSCSILTHCNMSGDLVLIGHLLRERGASIRFFATETRPYLQGTRLTAWELSRAGFDVSVLPDRAAAQVIEQGLVDTVVVGADRCTRRGDVINKVGTYPLSVLARSKGIPFYALVQDVEEMLADEVIIEERPHEELLSFHGHRLAAEGAECRYPAFDTTPAGLVTRLVGFSSVYSPKDFKNQFDRSKRRREEEETEEKSYMLLFGLPQESFYHHLHEGSRIEGRREVLVPELRPSLIGAREVLPKLSQAGLEPTLVSDNMLGFFFQRQAIRRAYIAYREFTDQGALAPGGSIMVARLAKAHEVPVELIPCGEEAGGGDADVTSFLGESLSTPGVSPYPLTDEIVPWSLF